MLYRLFNKKNNMKYFKKLIIVQMWATSIQLFAYIQCEFNQIVLNHAYGNAEKWLSHTKSGHFFFFFF